MKKNILFLFWFFLFACGLSYWHPLIKSEGLSRSAFYLQKLFSENQSLIIAGDSRVNNAIDPRLFKEIDGIESALNFSFPAVVFSSDYLDAIESRLHSSGRKVIVLGVTALSLSTKNEKVNRFTLNSEIPLPMRYARYYLGGVLDFFKAYPIEDEFYYKLIHGHWQALAGRAINHENGWSEVYLKKNNHKNQKDTLKNWLDGNQVNGPLVDHLVSRIRKWGSDGIEVFLFYPPLSSAFMKSENQASGFANFMEPLETSGARLIKVTGEFATIDGHHLDGDGAKKFSEQLLNKIRQHLDGHVPH